MPVAGVVLLLAVVILLYGIGAHGVLTESDDATAVLKGKSMANGNVLLSGWRSTSDSFLTIDEPIYAVAILIVGVIPGLMTAVPALIAGLIVVLGMRMVSGAGNRAGTIAGAVTVLAYLAFPTHTFAQGYLEGMVHDGTALWTLLGIWTLRRNRWDWWFVIAVLLLGTGLLGDLQLLAYAVVPIALAGVVAMLRCRRLRAGLVPISAAVASLVVAEITHRILVAIGTYRENANNQTASHHELKTNLHLLFNFAHQMLGVGNVSYGTGGVPVWLQSFHVIGAVVIAMGLLVALIRLVQAAATGRHRHQPAGEQTWRVDDMLALAVFGPAVAFLFLTLGPYASYMRYLTASVIFAAVLAGRMVARGWTRLTLASAKRPAWTRGRTTLAAIGLAVVAAFAAAAGFQIAQPAALQAAAPLASWLEAHHLTRGVGDYWSASITTVQSQERVVVRPVEINTSGRLVGFDTGPLTSWFGKARFQFLVFAPNAIGGVDTVSATNSFGSPTSAYKVARYYTVLVWSQPFAVTP